MWTISGLLFANIEQLGKLNVYCCEFDMDFFYKNSMMNFKQCSFMTSNVITKEVQLYAHHIGEELLKNSRNGKTVTATQPQF